VRWQFELQVTLLEAPTVKVQVAPPVQLRLADAPATSVHWLPPLQPPLHEVPHESLVQVPPGHETLQLFPDGSHVFLLHPVGVLPHATDRASNPSRSQFIRAPSLGSC
jgi:hypothetical protein